MFPQGYFYILSCKHGFALDVQDGSTKEDSNIIVWPQKFEDSDNQLWSYVNGRLINKKSNHAVDIRSSAFKKDKVIVQNKQKDKNQSQYWSFDQGFICSQEYPSMVFDIKGDSEKGGAQVLLYKRKESDNLNQKWYIEPYHDIEASLNLAVKDVQLNKKEGFGLPQPGYAAQPGAPPELKSVPVNNSIAGVGYGQPSSSASLTTPTPTTSGPTAEPHNNYGGPTPPPKDYGTSQFAPPTHSVSSSSLYSNPPPPPPSDAYPPPPPPSDAYPPPQSTPYPPPQSNAYPPPQSNAYPPPQSNPYPPPNNNSYPPPSNNNSYPPPPSDYPPYSQQQQQQSIPVGSPGGYPPQSSQDATPGVGGFFLPPPNSPPPSQMPGMPSSQMNYPPPANNHGYYPPPPQ